VGSLALSNQSFSNSDTPWDSENTAVGYGALENNAPTATDNGYRNTAVGSMSLVGNTTGAYNTAVGYQAGYTNQTGSGNVFLGYKAGYNETGSNRLYIANSDTSTLIYGQFDTLMVGINTTTVTDTLSVKGGVHVDQGGVFDGSSFHSPAAALKFGSGDSGEGIASLRGASGNIDGLDFYTSYTSRMSITNSGFIGIGTSSPGVRLEVAGAIRAQFPGSGATPVCRDANNTLAACSSDARVKTNVASLATEKDVLAVLAGLRGVAFDWDTKNPKAANAGHAREIGFIAQEVEAVLPEVVHVEADGYRSMDYAKLTALLVEVAKAQQAQIEAKEARIAALEQKLGGQRGQIEQLAARLAALEDKEAAKR